MWWPKEASKEAGVVAALGRWRLLQLREVRCTFCHGGSDVGADGMVGCRGCVCCWLREGVVGCGWFLERGPALREREHCRERLDDKGKGRENGRL
jgi:hypothetical protein